MNQVRLQPFCTANSLPEIDIAASIDLQNGMLAIEYQLRGDLSAIDIPSPAPIPTRKFKLWESTCCEFFIGVPETSNYWEFNLSPSGDWNIFQLDDYRQGLREELAITSLPFKIDRQPDLLLLDLEFDLRQIIETKQAIEVAITAVIQPYHDETSYWAVIHCGTVADFHLRDSFTIDLNPSVQN